MKRTAEETAAIKRLIEQNMDKKPAELVEMINKSGVAVSGDVQKPYVNMQRFQLKKRGVKTKVAKERTMETVKAPESDYSFDGFIKKIEELAEYGKALREKQKEKIAAFLA